MTSSNPDPDISNILSDGSHDFLSPQLNDSFSPYTTSRPHSIASTSTPQQHHQQIHSTKSSDAGSDHRGLINLGIPAIVNGKATSQWGSKNVKPQSVHKACELCTAAKQKCSGDKPRCDRCAASHWDCVYTFRLRRSSAPRKPIPSSVPPPRSSIPIAQASSVVPHEWRVPTRSSCDVSTGYPINQKIMQRKVEEVSGDGGQRPAKRRRVRSLDKGKGTKLKENPLLCVEEYLQFIKDDGLLPMDDLFSNITTLGPLPPPPPSPSPSPPPTDYPMAHTTYQDSLINPAALLAALDAIARSADMGDPNSHSAALDQRSVQILAQMLDGRLNDSFVDVGMQDGSLDGYPQEPQETIAVTNDTPGGAFDRTAAVHSALHEALRNAQRTQQQQDHGHTMGGISGASGRHREEVDEEHQHFARFTNHVTDDSDHEVQVAGRSGPVEEDLRSMEQVITHGLSEVPSDVIASQDNGSGFLARQDYPAQVDPVAAGADSSGAYAQPPAEKDDAKMDDTKPCSHIQQLSDIMRSFFDLKFLPSPTLQGVFASTGPGIALAKDLPHCIACASVPNNIIPILALLSRLCITIAKAHPHTPHPLSLVVAGTQIMGTEIAPEIETHMVDIIWEQWRFRFAHQIIDVLESRAAAQLALARIANGEGLASTTDVPAADVAKIISSRRSSAVNDEDNASKAVELETANQTLLDALPRLRLHLSQSGGTIKR